MARNLVVCCDGTWNSPRQKDRGQVVPSNVVKMARAVVEDDPESPQIVYYDTGVGTGRGVDKWFGGGLGIGLTQNILEAYRFLAGTWQDGDTIYLFGFSRGAYTVRSLAGLIGRCGLPPAGDSKALERAYDLYRQATDDKGKAAAGAFKAKQRSPRIYFIGVWDTVGALGVPALSRYGLLRKTVRLLSRGSKYAHGFHDETLGDHVDHAYQALAIDERRGPFEPSIWKRGETDPQATVEQAWFCGAHSNVGGGYADAGLSDHAFMWMAVKAWNAGLKMNTRYLALRVDPNAHGELRDSLTLAYKVLPKYERKIGLADTVGEHIHFSVRKRLEHPTNLDYRPRNLDGVLDIQQRDGVLQVSAAKVAFTDAGSQVIERIRKASSASTWSA